MGKPMPEHLRIELLDAPCDFCGRVAPILRPFKLSETIHFRSKVIQFPWLCRACFVKEKEKWWREQVRKLKALGVKDA